ncbi:MAG: AbrB/MazE/SpoVT family DNA-binding domain-containing protein [Methanotrichaceae archaeon]
MKEIPTTLTVDSMGRVMIPKKIRDKYGINPGDLITVILKIEEKSQNPQVGQILALEPIPA